MSRCNTHSCCLSLLPQSAALVPFGLTLVYHVVLPVKYSFSLLCQLFHQDLPGGHRCELKETHSRRWWKTWESRLPASCVVFFVPSAPPHIQCSMYYFSLKRCHCWVHPTSWPGGTNRTMFTMGNFSYVGTPSLITRPFLSHSIQQHTRSLKSCI